MFEISPGAVITQSELHYVIPGAKAFKVILLLNDMYSCFFLFFFNEKLIFVKLKMLVPLLWDAGLYRIWTHTCHMTAGNQGSMSHRTQEVFL